MRTAFPIRRRNVSLVHPKQRLQDIATTRTRDKKYEKDREHAVLKRHNCVALVRKTGANDGGDHDRREQLSIAKARIYKANPSSGRIMTILNSKVFWLTSPEMPRHPLGEFHRLPKNTRRRIYRHHLVWPAGRLADEMINLLLHLSAPHRFLPACGQIGRLQAAVSAFAMETPTGVDACSVHFE
jgi:hypothetical protein